jgi:hypothetical protein
MQKILNKLRELIECHEDDNEVKQFMNSHIIDFSKIIDPSKSRATQEQQDRLWGELNKRLKNAERKQGNV